MWTASEETDGALKTDVALEAAKNAKKHLKMVIREGEVRGMRIEE